ncbi:hypothetical protein CROQUDRAFT_72416 [Cronartium quercuum f. sp. fusiforme G11]|uniref:histidinol-phosphate transaminase n=1 Tax=Cronartium quercuum f. sp. fusiforme G11 TaxID=708437 RepID=A0A9P6NWQ4_9BASI|nr:hypothetical protein CROQUDRAFT_72416 [Cronartium quercuum f. sp. fusiforme G11]
MSTSLQLGSQFEIQSFIRPNISSLKPYRCARDDYEVGILLDANENSLGNSLTSTLTEPPLDVHSLSLHRYPSPSNLPIKQNLCTYRNQSNPSLTPLEPENVFLGVGSDEVLDLLFRISCKPGHTESLGDQILITPPTYGMYTVCAHVNDLGVINVPLDQDFVIEPQKIIDAIISQPENRPIKLVILCSPGNPTGTTIPLKTIESILSNKSFTGLVVVDEAYIDFAGNDKSALLLLRKGYKNLVVVQTLSKGFGLAGIRLGIAYGSKELIQILNNTKAPYTISTPTSTLAYNATLLESLKKTQENIDQILSNRIWLSTHLLKLQGIGNILGASEANFILIEILRDGVPNSERAKKVYQTMAGGEVVVRYRGDEVGCKGCLRITVGTMNECEVVVKKLKETLELIP